MDDLCTNYGCDLTGHDDDTLLCFSHPECPGHDPEENSDE